MVSESYRRYVLGVLTLVYTLNFLDRGLIILLLQPIKDDLHLSDTQLGFLTGIAFGLFYATFGLPMARWADRGNRTTITSIAIGLWGTTVMLCLFVTNYFQLVISRIAAAVGEAGCMPPTYSLVGDYFPKPAERTLAIATYMLAGPLSALFSFVVGGWLNEAYGWRVAFVVMGAPAVLVAALVKFTVVEPRLLKPRVSDHERQMPHMRDVLSALWGQQSLRHLSASIIVLFTMGYGLGPWYAAFMIRSHGMQTEELGVWLGAIFGISGIVGVLLGGYVTGRWFSSDERSQMRLSALMIASLVPFFVLFLLLPQKHLAMAMLVPFVVVCNFFFGPAFALLQRLAVDEMRATTLAVVMLLVNLIGMGIGPQLVGMLSDALMPAVGRDSLRYAMLVMSFCGFWGAYHLWHVGQTVRTDLERIAGGAQLNDQLRRFQAKPPTNASKEAI